MTHSWATLLVICCCSLHLQEYVDAIIHNSKYGNYHKPPDSDYINMVSLTQKGYIQFLRYIDDVPPLTDYTFCIWIRSNNLTHNHPILSYSQHEEKRLIRVWITPLGQSVNLEILEQSVFEIPVNLVENHWYHICQSWSSQQAAWSLYLNRKMKASGFEPKLRGVQIEGGGDIVVGQEYTDFDKGLEDGIEGDIFGFNFVLASTLYPGNPTNILYPTKYTRYPNDFPYPKPYHTSEPKQRPQLESITSQTQPELSQLIEENLPRKFPLEHKSTTITSKASRTLILNVDDVNEEVPAVLNSISNPNRNPKGLLDMFQNLFRFLEPERIKIPVYRRSPMVYVHTPLRRFGSSSSLVNDINDVPKPLGLLLVELGFDCRYRKGAPLIGKGVLINWTKSHVRVFGGAILKSVQPFCV